MKAKGKRERLTSVQIRSEYLIEKEMQEIRSQIIPFAQAKGIYTNEDVERAFR